MSETTDFGFERVPPEEKARRVRGVFESVASKYDLMNDLMSAGLHRAWKRFAVETSGVRRGGAVLDVAGGTADLARLFAERVGPSGRVILTDINAAMLIAGRDRMLDEGRLMPAVQCNAEALPFPAQEFDCVCIGFGLRNVTRKDFALAEMRREPREMMRPPVRHAPARRVEPWKTDNLPGHFNRHRQRNRVPQTGQCGGKRPQPGQSRAAAQELRSQQDPTAGHDATCDRR